MARKEAVAYSVRRPFLYDGKVWKIGQIFRPEDIIRRGHAEVLVRSGRLDPEYQKPKAKRARKILPGESQEE